MDTQALNWDLNTAIVRIYEAALTPSLWPNILQYLSFTLEGSKCFLVYSDDKQKNRSCLINSEGFNDFSAEVCLFKKNPRDFSHAVLGDVILFDKQTPIISTLSNSQTSYLALFTRDRSRLFIPLLMDESIKAFLIVEPLRNKLSAIGMNALQLLLPHFVRAFQIDNKLSTLTHRNDSMMQVLERTNQSVFILNADLKVTFISHKAEQLLRRQSALRIDEKGHLKLFFTDEQNTLLRLLNDFLAKGIDTQYWAYSEKSLAIRHPDSIHPIRLRFLPIQNPDFQQPQLPFVAIFAFDPEQPRNIAAKYFKQAFALTPTEIKVAQLLACGFNVTEIAKIRNTTLESTRWQMKQVLYKTNTHSQAELVRLLIALSDSSNTDAHLITYPKTRQNRESHHEYI